MPIFKKMAERTPEECSQGMLDLCQVVDIATHGMFAERLRFVLLVMDDENKVRSVSNMSVESDLPLLLRHTADEIEQFQKDLPPKEKK